MTTFKQLCIAGAASLTLLSGLVTPVFGQEVLVNFVTGDGPFDRSNERCMSIETLSCAQVTSGPSITIGEFAAEFGVPFERVLKLNAWSSGVVSPNQVVPINRQFALHGKF